MNVIFDVFFLIAISAIRCSQYDIQAENLHVICA